MVTLNRDRQKMKYALLDKQIEVYETDSDGNIKYIDIDGVPTPVESGAKKLVYSEPIEFRASINNKLNEAIVQQYGIDDSTHYAQLVTTKGYLPLKEGSLIWKKSDVAYTSVGGQSVVDEKSADYTVLGVANEGLNFDLFLLKKQVK